jgi:hypothetical protein
MFFFIKHHDDDEVDDEDAMMCYSDVLAHDAELERGQVQGHTCKQREMYDKQFNSDT